GLALMLSSAALADDRAAANYQPCAACHGERAQGNPALAAPALAGQRAAYLERQLRHFKVGIRGADSQDVHGAQMRGMIATLPEEEFAAMAAYLASLPPPVAQPAEGANLMNGNNYYQSKCGACHGGSAQGNDRLNAPALAFLDTAYMKRQYANFQRGLRGTHEQDKYGRQMKMMSTTLPGDKDLGDVIAFMQTFSQER
ncbi:MAG: c-type cytochrome, partial [Halioglobus sp.]|nr:c-type cytochrome [Halioglobus sp.]